MKFKQLKKAYQKLQDEFDFSKRFPNYFHKWVFRVAFFCILLGFIFIAIAMDFDFKQHAYIECKSEFPCTNPFYFCDRMADNNTGAVFFSGVLIDCEQYDSFKCRDGICKDEFIESHTFVGVKPSENYNKFTYYSFIIIILAFIYNHILYVVKWKNVSDKSKDKRRN